MEKSSKVTFKYATQAKGLSITMSFSTHKFEEKLSIRISTTFGFCKLLMISYVPLNSDEIFQFLINASDGLQGNDI